MHKPNSIFEAANNILNEANVTKAQKVIRDAVLMNIRKVTDVWEESPATLKSIVAKAAFDIDDDGMARLDTGELFIYHVNKKQLKATGFGNSDNETVIPIGADSFVVLVAY